MGVTPSEVIVVDCQAGIRNSHRFLFVCFFFHVIDPFKSKSFGPSKQVNSDSAWRRCIDAGHNSSSQKNKPEEVTVGMLHLLSISLTNCSRLRILCRMIKEVSKGKGLNLGFSD